MPHLSPMSWLLAILTFWTVMLLLTSNIWWTNLHTFETGSLQAKGSKHLPWFWS
uniref:ATP synthase F0 subunit 8 n=1 Tax=Amynthas quintanus TaxID=585698 RepID=A0AA48GL78_9ANNE|nr:ATP synthase F0 subunit 8 [Amynthas quintanus]